MQSLITKKVRVITVFIVTVTWIMSLHFFFKPKINNFYTKDGIPPKVQQLSSRLINIWTDPILRKQALKEMHSLNPEWDLMSRTYFVLALANMALREPNFKQHACDIMDFIIDDTLVIEQKEGIYYFLMRYAHYKPWVMKPVKSHFIDGEIALMIGARKLVEETLIYKNILSERVELMISRMKKSPVLCAESYPDECWIFCNTVSLAAIRIADILDETDHSVFIKLWIDTAKKSLVESRSGLLISAFSVDGKPVPCAPGPEGSSIWMACHMLQIVDQNMANAQYQKAKKELARSLFGFGYSREWTKATLGSFDIDSGPVIPLLNASASASGLAMMAAGAFYDMDYLEKLITSLNFFGFPIKSDGKLRYQVSNFVGDSVLIYALAQGPLWSEVQRRSD